MKRWLPMVLCALVLTGCPDGDGERPTGPTFSPDPLALSAEEFHEFGVLAGTATQPPGDSAASSLGIDPLEVDEVLADVCGGGPEAIGFPPLNWPALPRDVPAYEQFFEQMGADCDVVLSATLAQLRAQTVNRMVHNQRFAEELEDISQDSADRFCQGMDRAQDITATLVAEALESSNIAPRGSGTLIEIGVSLVFELCPSIARSLLE